MNLKFPLFACFLISTLIGCSGSNDQVSGNLTPPLTPPTNTSADHPAAFSAAPVEHQKVIIAVMRQSLRLSNPPTSTPPSTQSSLMPSRKKDFASLFMGTAYADPRARYPYLTFLSLLCNQQAATAAGVRESSSRVNLAIEDKPNGLTVDTTSSSTQSVIRFNQEPYWVSYVGGQCYQVITGNTACNYRIAGTLFGEMNGTVTVPLAGSGSESSNRNTYDMTTTIYTLDSFGTLNISTNPSVDNISNADYNLTLNLRSHGSGTGTPSPQNVTTSGIISVNGVYYGIPDSATLQTRTREICGDDLPDQMVEVSAPENTPPAYPEPLF